MTPALPPVSLMDCEPRPDDFRARLTRGARGIREGRGFAIAGRHRGRRAAALLAAVGVPAFAAPHEWTSLQIGNAEAAAAAGEPMPFEQAGLSFPGSV